MNFDYSTFSQRITADQALQVYGESFCKHVDPEIIARLPFS